MHLFKKNNCLKNILLLETLDNNLA